MSRGKTIERLNSLAREASKTCHYPRGRDVDGSPYSAGREADDFLDLARVFYGGTGNLLVIMREELGEQPGVHDCANWILWALLLKHGADCEKP